MGTRSGAKRAKLLKAAREAKDYGAMMSLGRHKRPPPKRYGAGHTIRRKRRANANRGQRHGGFSKWG